MNEKIKRIIKIAGIVGKVLIIIFAIGFVVIMFVQGFKGITYILTALGLIGAAAGSVDELNKKRDKINVDLKAIKDEEKKLDEEEEKINETYNNIDTDTILDKLNNRGR